MTDPRPETLDREARLSNVDPVAVLRQLYEALASYERGMSADGRGGWSDATISAWRYTLREVILPWAVHAIAAEQRAEEAERYQAALEDFRDRGLRCDLTPTMRLDDPRETYMALVNYLRRQDGAVRERARRALAPHKAAEDE